MVVSAIRTAPHGCCLHVVKFRQKCCWRCRGSRLFLVTGPAAARRDEERAMYYQPLLARVLLATVCLLLLLAAITAVA